MGLSAHACRCRNRTLSAESAEGRLRLKENTFPLDTYPTQRGTARVPRVGECADRRCLAATYPREEPDALTSARAAIPGLSLDHAILDIRDR